ncbi:MAG: SxtJ family membrane protein [Smithellaceae bacterium]
MIIEEIKNIKSEQSDLKKFGLLIGAILFLGSCYLLWKQQQDHAVAGFILSAVLVVLAFVWPVVLKPFQKIWMALAVVMGYVMSKIIMAVVFYGMVTPIGLAGRLGGKKFLDLKMNKAVASYWIERGQTKTEKSNYERQF